MAGWGVSFLEIEGCGGGSVCSRFFKRSATYARSSFRVSQTFGDGKVSLGTFKTFAMYARSFSGVERLFRDGKVFSRMFTRSASCVESFSKEVCFYNSYYGEDRLEG